MHTPQQTANSGRETIAEHKECVGKVGLSENAAEVVWAPKAGISYRRGGADGFRPDEFCRVLNELWFEHVDKNAPLVRRLARSQINWQPGRQADDVFF